MEISTKDSFSSDKEQSQRDLRIPSRVLTNGSNFLLRIMTTLEFEKDLAFYGALAAMSTVLFEIFNTLPHISPGPGSSTSYSNLTKNMQPKSVTARLIK